MTEKTSWTEPRRLMIRRVCMGIQSMMDEISKGLAGTDRPMFPMR
jgi:hypothetical protein